MNVFPDLPWSQENATVHVEETIRMISSGLIIAVTESDDDNRIFIVCEDCKESFLLINPGEVGDQASQMIACLKLLPALMLALRHITECPFDGPKVVPQEDHKMPINRPYGKPQ
jgi:hypothetical protein